MKQLLILSGKGGTGKTTVASAFIHLLEVKTYADCDVDAPNLHLIKKPYASPDKKDFYGLPKAVIDTELCIGCLTCIKHCKFEAISLLNKIQVDSFACEGCGVCAFVCPADAVKLKDAVSGETMVYFNGVTFSTAKLKMGEGASGRLVTEVKKNMKCDKESNQIVIIDGSPGIGCPVIASMSGVDMVLIVTEPTISGLSDLERILNTASHFGIHRAVCINKYNISPVNTQKIESFCEKMQIPIVGKIPFDRKAVEAINHGKSITEIDCPSGRAMQEICKKTIKLLKEGVSNE